MDYLRSSINTLEPGRGGTQRAGMGRGAGRRVVRLGGRARAARGFTIIEVIVIVVILGVLTAVVVPRVWTRIGESKTAVGRSQAATLLNAVTNFAIDCGNPAEGASIDILWERPGDIEEGKWRGPYVRNRDDLLDPWGRPFMLIVPGQHNVDFDVVSYGADGAPGGDGENKDIVAGKKD